MIDANLKDKRFEFRREHVSLLSSLRPSRLRRATFNPPVDSCHRFFFPRAFPRKTSGSVERRGQRNHQYRIRIPDRILMSMNHGSGLVPEDPPPSFPPTPHKFLNALFSASPRSPRKFARNISFQFYNYLLSEVFFGLSV